MKGAVVVGKVVAQGARGGVVLALVLMASFASAVTSASAKNYVPTSTGDHPPHACNPRDCTLREAVIAANRHRGSDTIVLRSGQSYGRSSRASDEDASRNGDLDITDKLTIRSSGRGQATIDAQRHERVLSVINSAAKLKNLRLIHGKEGTGFSASGGGIYFQSSTPRQKLTVSRSTITQNRTQNYGGAIGGGGEGVVKLVRSTVSRNYAQFAGGGIASDFPLVVSKSSIESNRTGPTSGVGGGIDITSRSARIISSTISSNRSQRAGGVFVDAEFPDRVQLTNSTVSGNRADQTGGIGLNFNAVVSLKSTTVVRNIADLSGAGGITSSPEQVSVKDSLIARNVAPSNPDCEGTIDSGGRNLFGSSFGCAGFLASDRRDLTNGEIGIGALGSHGGPTDTVPLRASSKAIDRASSSAPGRDQRGRRRGSNPDIGAFERGGR